MNRRGFFSPFIDHEMKPGVTNEEYHDEYRRAERQSARLTIVEREPDNEAALFLLKVLGLDSFELPREALPLRKA